MKPEVTPMDGSACDTLENGSAEHKKTLRNANYAGYAVHTSWVLIFLYLDVPLLAAVNVINILVYAGCHYLLQANRMSLWATLSILNLLFSVSMSTWYVGWDTGIHYHIFISICAIFSVPDHSRATKAFFILLCSSLYLLLYAFADTPVVSLAPEHVRALHYYSLINVITTVLMLTSRSWGTMYKTLYELKVLNKQLEQYASTDPLTGLYNRRTMYDKLERVNAIKHETGMPYAILIADIDNFKKFNDDYGHECGDFVLIQSAERIRGRLRAADAVSRWGGEEFLVLLPNTGLEEAYAIAEGLRQHIAERVFPFNGVEHRITLTFGVAVHEGSEEIHTFIHNADRALLEGKSLGKNSVILYKQPSAMY
jgi:diguanylate cyclase